MERFFSGATPGGEGRWVRNPGLEAESSVGADLGIRLRTAALEGELFVHRTVLHDGIRLEPTGREVDGVPEYRNENVDELVARGVEAWASWTPLPSLAVTLAADLLDRANPADPEDPLAEGLRSRVTGAASLVVLPSRLTVAWETEWRGSHRQAPGGAGGPVGSRIPAYDVHDARAVLTLGEGRELVVGVDNVFDRLHARASNVAFFRPEPGRALVVSLRAAF